MERMTRPVGQACLLLLFCFSVATTSALPAMAQIPVQSGSVGAADPRFDHVRFQIRQVMRKEQLPSVSIAVAQHGKIIWEQGFGWADREKLLPATSDTMYSLASISKPFTATAIMELVQQGKIHLDSPANDYLGAAKITGLAGDASGATIRRILSHTSGLPLHWQFFYSNEDDPAPPMDETISRYAILVNPPGEVYQYSNLGFGILGYILSREAGVSYADAMRTLVFAPLDLTHTSVGIGPGLENYAAARYDSQMRPIPFYTFDHLGASAIYSSAHDLVRFAMFHLKDHLSDQQPILSDSTIDLMHQPVTPMNTPSEFYALGFFGSSDDHGLKTVGHDGGMPGVSTIMRLYSDQDLALVVLTNTSPADVYGSVPAVPGIAQDIVAALIPRYARNLELPRKETPSRHPYHPVPELLGAWTGTVRTWQATIPFQLVFQPDGDIHVKLGDQLEALLDGAEWQDNMLVGVFAGSIPTPDAERFRHHMRLELWMRNGKLEGEANAEAAEEPAHYSLASYVELSRTKH
ncbi:MAG: serine hydrolase domain-containing protein [Terriglobia bacterium]